jgi:hypothetical protein
MEADIRPDKLDPTSFYRLLRSRMDHEDLLVVNRLSWLVASQAFLFTGYALAVTGLTAPQVEALRTHLSHLLRLIPLVAVISAALIYMSLLAGMRATAWLHALYRRKGSDETSLGLPPIEVPRRIVMWGLVAPMVLPPVYVVIWLYLLLSFST